MVKQLTQEQVWDKIAQPWKEFRGKPYNEVQEFLKDKTGNILDLACGSGRHFIKNKNQTLYACDFSSSMVKLAEKYAEKAKINAIIEKCNAEKLPYKDNLFDAVIFIAAFHCIETKTKRKKALEELKRIMKPKTQALITVWNYNQPRFKGMKKEALIPWKNNNKEYKRYYYLYDPKEFENELKDAGFKVKKIWENENIFAIIEK